MALIECRECGRQVSTEAAACPGCGAPPRPVHKPLMPPMPAEPKSSALGTAAKWIGGLAAGFVVLVLFLGSRPVDPRFAAKRKAECEAAIKSGIGHSTRNYSDKLAYEKAVDDACGGPGLPYLREAAGTGGKEGCPADFPTCS